MADITAASLWNDADVWIAPLATTPPADASTDFGVGWEKVGLLDGDAGFTQSRSEDVADHHAWGGVLVRTSRRNFKMTISFTAFEFNDTTRDLIWPGSTATALVVPRPEQLLIAFEMREGAKVRRLISAEYAEITLNGDITDNETSLTAYSMQATIFPDTSTDPATLLTVQESV